jgi:hypothetical protein
MKLPGINGSLHVKTLTDQKECRNLHRLMVMVSSFTGSNMHVETIGMGDIKTSVTRKWNKSLMRNKMVDKRHWLFIENAQSGI